MSMCMWLFLELSNYGKPFVAKNSGTHLMPLPAPSSGDKVLNSGDKC